MKISELFTYVALAGPNAEVYIELPDRKTIIPLECVLLADDGRIIFKTRPEKLSEKEMQALEEFGEVETVRYLRYPRRRKKGR